MSDILKVAVPLVGDEVSAHFGHPDCFAIVEVNKETRKIVEEERLNPPPHEPGSLPLWLAANRVGVVLAGGIGARAVNILQAKGIAVVSGVPALGLTDAVSRWLGGELQTEPNVCDHGSHGPDHSCGHSPGGGGGCQH